MSNEKKVIISIIVSFIIVFSFIFLFSILQFNIDDIWIAMVVIIAFTMLYCTYSIIDEIRKLKDSINKCNIEDNKQLAILDRGFSINLDINPKNKKLFITEVERYCTQENLNYEIVDYENNDMECLVKIDNIIYKCTLLYSGKASDYIIKFDRI